MTAKKSTPTPARAAERPAGKGAKKVLSQTGKRRLAPKRRTPTLDRFEQRLRDIPHDFDTLAFREEVVAAIYSQLEADYYEVDDYEAALLDRYLRAELTIQEVRKRTRFRASNRH